MPGVGKHDEFFAAGKILKNRFCLGSRHTCIFGAMQKQDWTPHVPRIFDGVVVKRVEAVLDTAPKDQQIGGRKGGQPHRGETVGGCRKQTVERALDDHSVRSNAVDSNRPQDRRAPHRLAVQDEMASRKLPPHVFDRLGKVVGLADAD